MYTYHVLHYTTLLNITLNAHRHMHTHTPMRTVTHHRRRRQVWLRRRQRYSPCRSAPPAAGSPGRSDDPPPQRYAPSLHTAGTGPEQTIHYIRLLIRYLSCPNVMHGKFGLFSPGKASSHSTALNPGLGVCFFLCAVFLCLCTVNVIHQTLTWTTGSLTYTRDYSYAWRGHDESGQHFDSEKTFTIFSCAPDGVQTSTHGIHWTSRPTLYQFIEPPCDKTWTLFFISILLLPGMLHVCIQDLTACSPPPPPPPPSLSLTSSAKCHEHVFQKYGVN